MSILKEYIEKAMLESLKDTSTKAPGAGTTTKNVGGYLDHPNRGHHDGSDGVTHHYVMYKPKTTLNSLKKAGWNHVPGGNDKYHQPKHDTYIHPDGHTKIRHKPGTSEFKVDYKGEKRPKRVIDYSQPGHYD